MNAHNNLTGVEQDHSRPKANALKLKSFEQYHVKLAFVREQDLKVNSTEFLPLVTID